MTKHIGYDLVRPMFDSGALKNLSDIFKFELVPITVVAKDLGKDKTRFKQLVDNPDEFNYQEVKLFGANCKMEPFEMGILIQTEHPRSSPNVDQQKEVKFLAINPMVKAGTISSLEGIIKYIGKYKIARKIGIKGSTLDRYLKKLGIFPIGDLRSIGELFDLDLSEMLKLVAAQYDAQKNNTRKT